MVASSTISGDVRLPPENPAAVHEHDEGSLCDGIADGAVHVELERDGGALLVDGGAVGDAGCLVTSAKTVSRYRSGASPVGTMSCSQPLATSARTARHRIGGAADHCGFSYALGAAFHGERRWRGRKRTRTSDLAV